MKNQVLSFVVASLIAAPAFAAGKGSTNKHEAAGLGSGVVVGAVVGGPIGAIVGASVGGWFGDRFHRERTARLDFEQRYDEAQVKAGRAEAEAEQLESQLAGSAQRIASLESEIQQEKRVYRSTLQQALNTQIFFRTGEATIQEDSLSNLERMARLIDSLDGFVIHLEGHADPRGDEKYNEELSAARAAAVRDALVAAGLPSQRITLSAAGETQSRAEEKDLDAMALERRVHIELIGLDEAGRVARE
jgi:outer membrane protein OmpA-like peptidoglycan-associated protein